MGLPRVCWNRRVPPSGLWLCGTPAAANVFLLCGHDSVSPHTAQETCPRLCLRAKDHLEGTKVAAFPSLCAPQKVQSGSAAGLAVTDEWRPGKATGDPATHGGAGDPASVREQCVGTCDRGLEEGAAHRRCVTSPLRSQLRAAAAEQGVPTAQPLGVTSLLLGSGPLLLGDFLTRPRTRCSCNHGQWWDVAENFLMDRRHDGAVSLRCVQNVVRDCRSDHSLFFPRPSGLWGKLSDRTECPVRSSSRAEQEKIPAAHFCSDGRFYWKITTVGATLQNWANFQNSRFDLPEHFTETMARD